MTSGTFEEVVLISWFSFLVSHDLLAVWDSWPFVELEVSLSLLSSGHLVDFLLNMPGLVEVLLIQALGPLYQPKDQAEN